MDEHDRARFEKLEAIQYLVEENELASIELECRLNSIRKLVTIDEKYGGIRSSEAPALVEQSSSNPTK